MLVGFDEWEGVVSFYSNKQWGQLLAHFDSHSNIHQIFQEHLIL